MRAALGMKSCWGALSYRVESGSPICCGEFAGSDGSSRGPMKYEADDYAAALLTKQASHRAADLFVRKARSVTQSNHGMSPRNGCLVIPKRQTE